MSLFNTRDVHGNEVASGYSSASSSDSDGDFTFDERTLPSSTPQSDPSTSIDNSQPDTAPTSHLQSKINQALTYLAISRFLYERTCPGVREKVGGGFMIKNVVN